MPKTTRKKAATKRATWKGPKAAPRKRATKPAAAEPSNVVRLLPPPAAAEPAVAAAPADEAELRIRVPGNRATAIAERLASLLHLPVHAVHTDGQLQVVDPPTNSARDGKAGRTILELATRREGASSKELYAATGWKFASWSHQMKQLRDKHELTFRTDKVDGELRYFLAPQGDA